MQLRLEQLTSHLQKPLAPVYLISGDVPLLMQEACDAIRATAQAQGYLERQILQVENNFAWQNLMNAANNFSLFSEKQLLELRVVSNTLGDGGSKAIQAYLARPASDKVLLITMGKLDSSAQRAAWFQAVANTGVVMQLWPLEKTQLPSWINQRLVKAGLKIDAAGVQLLADYAEGNLLAAQQEIDKLQLVYGSNSVIKAEEIAQAINDSARFDVFALSDAALQGDGKRVVRVLNNLKGEGVEPILILWSLARELRGLLLQQQPVWEKRKTLVRAALQRHSVIYLQQLLKQASVIDQMIKGLAIGNVWNALTDLALALAGVTCKK
jgi:DNA polymerase III subunit delta